MKKYRITKLNQADKKLVGYSLGWINVMTPDNEVLKIMREKYGIEGEDMSPACKREFDAFVLKKHKANRREYFQIMGR